jgi:hypothetical protein
MKMNVRYTNKVSDPIFGASEVNNSVSIPGPVTVWTPDQNISALGCIEQFQACQNNSCTEPASFYQMIHPQSLEKLHLNENQRVTLNHLTDIEYGSRLNWFDYLIGDEFLLAKEKLYFYGNFAFSSSLPDNQWELEVENFHNITLAILQMGVLAYVVPDNTKISPTATMNQYRVSPDTPEGKNLCKSQKIRSTKYTSFSFFGIVMIIISSFLIITLSSLICKRYRGEWNQYDVLELVSEVFNHQEMVDWMGEERNVPVTPEDESNAPVTPDDERNMQVTPEDERNVLVAPEDERIRRSSTLDEESPISEYHSFSSGRSSDIANAPNC